MKLKTTELKQQLPTTSSVLKTIDVIDNALSSLLIRDDADIKDIRNNIKSIIHVFNGKTRENLCVKPTVIECDINEANIDDKSNFLVFVQEPMKLDNEGNVLWK